MITGGYLFLGILQPIFSADLIYFCSAETQNRFDKWRWSGWSRQSRRECRVWHCDQHLRMPKLEMLPSGTLVHELEM